jgi:hypothetical protein
MALQSGFEHRYEIRDRLVDTHGELGGVEGDAHARVIQPDADSCGDGCEEEGEQADGGEGEAEAEAEFGMKARHCGEAAYRAGRGA